MTSARDVGIDLMNRLLAGERGEVPLLLAMLLEKSSALASTDEHYRQLHLPELVGLRLSPQTTDEITAILCSEISRNPDEALISAIAFTGADLATKTAVKILTNPPRPLTLAEVWSALSVVVKFLPFRLAENSEFLPRADLDRLVELAKEHKDVEESDPDRSARIGVRHHAAQLLESLKQLGIRGS